MEKVLFETEKLRIAAQRDDASVLFSVGITDKLSRKEHTTKWKNYEIAAVISMILAEGGFVREVDDNLFHIAVNAIKEFEPSSIF